MYTLPAADFAVRIVGLVRANAILVGVDLISLVMLSRVPRIDDMHFAGVGIVLATKDVVIELHQEETQQKYKQKG